MCFEKSLWILRMCGWTIPGYVFVHSPQRPLIHRVACHLKWLDVWQWGPRQPLSQSLISCTVQWLYHCQVSPHWRLMLKDKNFISSLGPAKWASCLQCWKTWWWNSKRRVVSRLYYEQASAIFTQYGKGGKAIEVIISARAFANTNMEICREKLWTKAVLQLAGFQMSSDVSL